MSIIVMGGAHLTTATDDETTEQNRGIIVIGGALPLMRLQNRGIIMIGGAHLTSATGFLWTYMLRCIGTGNIHFWLSFLVVFISW